MRNTLLALILLATSVACDRPLPAPEVIQDHVEKQLAHAERVLEAVRPAAEACAASPGFAPCDVLIDAFAYTNLSLKQARAAVQSGVNVVGAIGQLARDVQGLVQALSALPEEDAGAPANE